MSPESADLIITRAGEDEEQLVREFLVSHFYGESPLHVAFGVVEDRPPPGWRLGLRTDGKDFALKAETVRGELVGVACVQRGCSSWRDRAKSPGNKNLLDFVAFAKSQSGVDSLSEDTTELRILSVRPDWRGRGLASRLVEESERITRDSGFKSMWSCVVSEFSARVVRAQHWTEKYRLAYKDYPSLSGSGVQLRPTPPHEHLYYFVKEL